MKPKTKGRLKFTTGVGIFTAVGVVSIGFKATACIIAVFIGMLLIVDGITWI